MSLTDKHLNDVCLLHQSHKQCRYLDNVEGESGWFSSYICKKKTPKKKIIDKEVEIFFDEMAEKGLDPNSQGLPLGNNCDGYLNFKAKMQGYDLEM